MSSTATRCHPLHAVVLAAGISQRFGMDKRLARTSSGSSLLQAALEALGDHVAGISVAVRPSDVIDKSWPLQVGNTRVDYVPAPRAAQGMGCSLADVVRQLPGDCCVMVALADMPYIRSATVGKVLKHYARSAKAAPIVFPVLAGSAQAGKNDAGRRGHPVIFHPHYRDELEALKGDKGAGSIILAHPAALDPLEVDDRGVLIDIDRPTDLFQPF